MLFSGLFVIKIAEDRFIFKWSFRIILFTSVKRIQADFGSVPYGVSYFLGKIENKERSGEYEDDCL